MTVHLLFCLLVPAFQSYDRQYEFHNVHAQMSSQSALEYARYHGLAVNRFTVFEEAFALTIQRLARSTTNYHDAITDGSSPNATVDVCSTTHRISEENKIRLTAKKVSQLQCLVTSHSKLLHLDLTETWQMLLPNPNRQQQLHLQLPLLGSKRGDDEQACGSGWQCTHMGSLIHNLLEHQRIFLLHTETKYRVDSGVQSIHWSNACNTFEKEFNNERIEATVRTLLTLEAILKKIQSQEVVVRSMMNGFLPNTKRSRMFPMILMEADNILDTDKTNDDDALEEPRTRNDRSSSLLSILSRVADHSTCKTQNLQEPLKKESSNRSVIYSTMPEKLKLDHQSAIDRSTFSINQDILLSGALQKEAPRVMPHAELKEDLQLHASLSFHSIFPGHETLIGGESCLIAMMSKFDKTTSSKILLWEDTGLKVLDRNEDRYDAQDKPLPPHSVVGESEDPGNAHQLSPTLEQWNGSISRTCTTIPQPTGSKGLLIDANEKPIRSLEDSAQIKSSWENTRHTQEEAFSTSISLDAFLALRGRKAITKTPGIYSTPVGINHDLVEPRQQIIVSDYSTNGTWMRPCARTFEDKTIPLSQAPIQDEHQPLLRQQSVVVNNTLVQSHLDLLIFCENKGGSLLQMIYRDFIVIDKAHPDIILNPGSCLLITNIQQFKQCSLPGGKNSKQPPNTQDRIFSLCQEYQHVFVLIAISCITLSETKSMTRTSAICSSLRYCTHGKAVPIYLTFRTPEDLKYATRGWIWNLIRNYAYSSPEIDSNDSDIQALPLRQDETTWELFLRQAGMNIMVAQLILSKLQDYAKTRNCSGIEADNQRESVGLRQLVNMSTSERLQMLDGFIESKLMETLSSALNSNI